MDVCEGTNAKYMYSVVCLRRNSAASFYVDLYIVHVCVCVCVCVCRCGAS